MPSYNITFEELTQEFGLPLNEVAKKFGLCVTLLKKHCRDLGIPRWPHRKLSSLNNLIKKYEEEIRENPDDEAAKFFLNELKETKKTIIERPSILGTKSNTNENFRIKRIISKLKKDKKKKQRELNQFQWLHPLSKLDCGSISQELSNNDSSHLYYSSSESSSTSRSSSNSPSSFESPIVNKEQNSAFRKTISLPSLESCFPSLSLNTSLNHNSKTFYRSKSAYVLSTLPSFSKLTDLSEAPLPRFNTTTNVPSRKDHPLPLPDWFLEEKERILRSTNTQAY